MMGSSSALRLELVAQIVASYVGNNSVAAGELPALIERVHRAFDMLGAAPAVVVPPAPAPAVTVRKSVTPDFIICLEDGKKFKSLKRHLMTSYGLTPDAYREKWKLPHDYPMVAPNYAATRSVLARTLGLGRKRAPVEVMAPESVPVQKPTLRRKNASA